MVSLVFLTVRCLTNDQSVYATLAKIELPANVKAELSRIARLSDYAKLNSKLELFKPQLQSIKLVDYELLSESVDPTVVNLQVKRLVANYNSWIYVLSDSVPGKELTIKSAAPQTYWSSEAFRRNLQPYTMEFTDQRAFKLSEKTILSALAEAKTPEARGKIVASLRDLETNSSISALQWLSGTGEIKFDAAADFLAGRITLEAKLKEFTMIPSARSFTVNVCCKDKKGNPQPGWEIVAARPSERERYIKWDWSKQPYKPADPQDFILVGYGPEAKNRLPSGTWTIWCRKPNKKGYVDQPVVQVDPVDVQSDETSLTAYVNG